MIERGNMWFRDDGALTRVFCEDSKYNTAVTRLISIASVAVRHNLAHKVQHHCLVSTLSKISKSPLHVQNKPVDDMARAYTGDADAVLDYGLLIAT